MRQLPKQCETGLYAQEPTSLVEMTDKFDHCDSLVIFVIMRILQPHENFAVPTRVHGFSVRQPLKAFKQAATLLRAAEIGDTFTLLFPN